ncbi:hypothetical protein [Methylobacterium sp. Leaf117]|uniref:hypothetical protein n=1 Tax=Methylobacterium sp. Leaf117 TaxID=1736260 RepID=UPI0006F60001|nr:hypothetical protein [Methylobacterium sp. Leaf117]KQP82966.1 hypothetical protein ASF57_12665 [Methylobacterium sp. Leaf117]
MASSATDALFQEGPDDPDFDEPAPPSRAEEELDYKVFDLCKHLRQIADGDDPPWALDHVLRCLRSHVHDRKGLRPSGEDRDELLGVMTHALAGAIEHLPASYDRGKIRLGMNAARGLVIYWAETDAARAQRHPHVLPDLLAYAALLRNDARSMTLVEEIRERANLRQRDLLAGLYEAFGNEGAA